MKKNNWLLVVVFLLLGILLFEGCFNNENETKKKGITERFLTDYYDDGNVKSTFLYNGNWMVMGFMNIIIVMG